jgi:hypothetical protein
LAGKWPISSLSESDLGMDKRNKAWFRSVSSVRRFKLIQAFGLVKQTWKKDICFGGWREGEGEKRFKVNQDGTGLKW